MKIYNKENIKKYDLLYKGGHDHSYPNLDLVRILSSYVKTKKSNILDYGFGSGENIIHMTKLDFKKIYGIEASGEAIKLLKKKLKEKKLKRKNIFLKKLTEDHKKLSYKSNFFDNIVCTSVLSLLGRKENIKFLIEEFYRILKPKGKLIVDVNGPKSSFKKKGRFISNDTYLTYINKKSEKVLTYCPKNLKIFSKLFNKFYIDELGEIKFKYFSFSGHEFIACLRKK